MSELIINSSMKPDTSLQTLSPSLQDSIKSIIKQSNYIKCCVEIENFTTVGNNFLGKLYKVKITGETVEGKKVDHIFVKEKLDMKKFKLLNLTELYINEDFFYSDLSKIFMTLQDRANIPEEDRYRIAKAYDSGVNAVFLEDLSQRGFRSYGKLEPISIKYAELTIQELAKFHALSFVIESEMPEYFNSKIKIRKYLFKYDEEWDVLVSKIFTHCANVCDDDMRPKIENFLPTFLEKFTKYCNDQSSVRCTLLHGDFKKNNMMVRFKDGEPVEVFLVDFQLINYGCPIIDFMYFIFTATDREFRKLHLNNLKALYFESLSRFLKHFDMDVEDVYPRREFEKVYTEWLDYGLMAGLATSVVAFAPDEGIDFDNIDLSEITFCPDKRYDYIFRGLVEDFVEWGYL